MELRLFKTLANNIVSVLENDSGSVKEDEWSKYYFNKYHATLGKVFTFSILEYFFFLYILTQYGMGVGQWEKRFQICYEFLFGIAVFLFIGTMFFGALLIYNPIVSADEITKDNYIKLKHFKLSITISNKITKFLFILDSLSIVTVFNVLLLLFPEKLVLLSVILTFTLYITCVMAGRFFRGVFRTGYRFFLLEIIVSLFVLMTSGVHRSGWYFVVMGIIGIILDSFFVLSLYSTGFDDMSAELADLTANLDEKNRKLMYDIYVYNEVPLLVIYLYGLVVDFISLFVGSSELDD